MSYEADMKARTDVVYANATVRAGRFGTLQIANGRKEVSEVDTLGATAHCVILEDAEAGDKLQVAYPGQLVTVEAGAAIVAAFVNGEIDATGRLTTHSGTTGRYVMGQPHETAAAAGDQVSFFFGTPYPEPA